MSYQGIRMEMSLKQGVAVRSALENLIERVSSCDLRDPLGYKWEQEAMFLLLVRLSAAIARGEENKAKSDAYWAGKLLEQDQGGSHDGR